MRLYSFTNMYMGGIHAGIQTAHVIHTMQRKYELKGSLDKKAILDEWLDNHKTIYVLNGGNQASLQWLYRELTEYSALLSLPIGKWHEGKEDLNGAMTAACIVVPEYVYNFGDGGIATEGMSDEELKIACAIGNLSRLLKQYRFAN